MLYGILINHVLISVFFTAIGLANYVSAATKPTRRPVGARRGGTDCAHIPTFLLTDKLLNSFALYYSVSIFIYVCFLVSYLNMGKIVAEVTMVINVGTSYKIEFNLFYSFFIAQK